MMQNLINFLNSNKDWLFPLIGTLVVSVITAFLSYKKGYSDAQQTMFIKNQGSNNSINQAGRDMGS